MINTTVPQPPRSGARYCRRCGSPMNVALSSVTGVQCPRCGAVSSRRQQVRGESVLIKRPTELNAVPIEIGRAHTRSRTLPGDWKRVAARAVAGSRVVAGVAARAWQVAMTGWETFQGYPARIQISITAVAAAIGASALVVAVLS